MISSVDAKELSDISVSNLNFILSLIDVSILEGKYSIIIEDKRMTDEISVRLRDDYGYVIYKQKFENSIYDRYAINWTTPTSIFTYTQLAGGIGRYTQGVSLSPSSPFVGGSGSYSFNGINGFLEIYPGADTAFGTGDYTIEWFYYENSQKLHPRFFSIGNYYSAATMDCSVENNKWWFGEKGGWMNHGESIGGDLTGQWHHFAIVRISGFTSMYKDANLIASFVDNKDLNNTTTPLIISQDNLLNDPNCYIDGLISNFRWVKGLGVYTQSGFTVPTSDLTAISVANPYGGSYTEAIGSGYTKYLLNPLSLSLTFDNISNADLLIGGSSSNFTVWNTFFDLPTNGSPFTSVEIAGNAVNLRGGSGITLTDSLFTKGGYGASLLSMVDTLGCIVTANYDVFGTNNYVGCSSLTTVSLPSLTTAGIYCFQGCYGLTTINFPELTSIGNYAFQSCDLLATVNLPKVLTIGDNAFEVDSSLASLSIPMCTNLGTTVGYNDVFNGVFMNTITITIPTALMTCNDGITTFDPDGDIQALVAGNFVTIIQV